jgi:hypothetical protein
VPAAFPQIVTNMPVAVPGGRDAAQGLLYATRSVVRMPGEAPARVRSNPLLINLYRSA